jgi:uncharacterized membrane protein YfcA
VEPIELGFVALAGLVAGGLNAVAGGGWLICFPALVYVGLPPLQANVTNSVAVFPGYVGTTLGYRRELSGQRRRVAVLAVTALLGGGTGAALLLTTPASVFERVVPGLVIGASLLLAVQTVVTRWVQALPGSAGGQQSPLLVNAVALVAFSLFGPVDWSAVAVIAPSSLLGGYLGARVARRLDAMVLRSVVVVFGVVVGIALFWRRGPGARAVRR